MPNHLVPYFGTQDMQTITRTQLRTFPRQKYQRYSLNYVRALLRMLHTIFAHALEEELIGHNPAAKLGKYLPEKHTDPDREINPCTSAELARNLTTMQTKYPQHIPYFLCLARTGMREGEALALTWGDV
jgi:integrase